MIRFSRFVNNIIVNVHVCVLVSCRFIDRYCICGNERISKTTDENPTATHECFVKTKIHRIIYIVYLFFLIGHTHVVFDLVPTKTCTGYRQMTARRMCN